MILPEYLFPLQFPAPCVIYLENFWTPSNGFPWELRSAGKWGRCVVTSTQPFDPCCCSVSQQRKKIREDHHQCHSGGEPGSGVTLLQDSVDFYRFLEQHDITSRFNSKITSCRWHDKASPHVTDFRKVGGGHPRMVGVVLLPTGRILNDGEYQEIYWQTATNTH